MFIHRECLGKFGDILGKEVWDGINSVFDVLPFAAVIDDKVCRVYFPFPRNSDLSFRFYVYMVVFQVRRHVPMNLFQWLIIYLYR